MSASPPLNRPLVKLPLLLRQFKLSPPAKASSKVQDKVVPKAPVWVLVAIGIWLLLRANRDAGSERSGGGFFSRISDAVLARRSARRMAVSRRDDDEEPSVLNRLDITFPNIVDRYILREFLKVLGLVLVSVIALSLIIDYTGISGDIRENHIAFHTS